MYKVRIMISIFQGMPRKIPGSYTLVAGFLICQYTFQYTSCILCVTGGILGGTWKVRIRNFTLVAGFLICQYTFQYTPCMLCVMSGGILGGTWKVCIRNFTLVAGFLICQYTFQYTSCILCITGGILGGMWKACIRNFTVVVGFLLVQAICQYTVCILGKSRGILNAVWKESVLISYILWIMTPGFQLALEWNLFSGLLVTGFLGIQISDLKMLQIKHHFYRFLPFYFFYLQLKTWSIFILNSTQWKLSCASLACTIKMELTVVHSKQLFYTQNVLLISNGNTMLTCRLRVPFPWPWWPQELEVPWLEMTCQSAT